MVFTRQKKNFVVMLGLLILPILLITGISFAKEQISLRFAHAQTEGEIYRLYSAIPKAYEALHPNVKIEVIVQDQQIYEDYGLDTMLEGPTPPDVYALHGRHELVVKAEVGFAADIENFVKPWKDRFIEATLDVPSINGRLYAVPRAEELVTAMWYNRKIFDRFGFAEPQSWSELTDICQTLKANGVTPISFGNSQLWAFGNWASLITARMVGKQRWEAAMELRERFLQPDFVKALSLIQEMGEAGFFAPDMNVVHPDKGIMNWFMGWGAIHPLGGWIPSFVAAEAPEDFEYDVFDLPPVPGGKGDPHMQEIMIVNLVVNGKTKYLEQCVDFLKFFTSSYNAQLLVEAGSMMPVKKAHELAAVDPHLVKAFGFGELAKEIIGAPDEDFAVEVADTFSEGAAMVALEKKNAEEALRWVDEQLEPRRTR